jgi:ubiquinone/menaquinone biosynthesis C-methylase UbiE
MTDDIKRWLAKDGEIFLDEVGVKEGDVLLDFGCGKGHYTIPSAKLVGEEGRICALDEDGEVLDELMKIAKLESLKNIDPIKTSGELKIPLEDESVDVVLLYDVLHYMNERRRIIDDVYRVMKPGGLLSVYPKHHSSDSPLRGLANLTLKDIIKEIKEAGFSFEKKYFKRLVHDDNYDRGYILNFRKGSHDGSF